MVGLAFEDVITGHLGEPWQIAILLAVFALVLWLVDRRPATRAAHELSLKEGFAVGVAQALALAPGVSRSGITITAGRLFCLDRDAAARLSFLLLVPTVLGAVLLKGVQDVLLGDLPAGLEGAVRGRACSRRGERACSRSSGCSATSAGTPTGCSSSTAWSPPRSSCC